MDSSNSRDDKPRLDETSFQKLLAAAYVIQQHQRQQLQPVVERSAGQSSADADYATTLAEIVETQHQIQIHHLDLDGSAGMVVEQIQKITSASGAAVCLLDRDHLVYRAVNGLAAAEIGQAIPRSQSISGSALSQGVVLRCPDALADPQVDPVTVGRARIASFLSVPIFHEDQVAGVLELTFNRPNAYREHDVRTCQLMAGLITEVLARTADNQWKKNLTAERDSMLEALEKLKPQLDRLAKETGLSSARAGHLRSNPAPQRESLRREMPDYESALKPIPNSSVLKNDVVRPPTAGLEPCHRCGHEMSAQEVYCGNCGSLRSDRPRTGSGQKVSNPTNTAAPTAPFTDTVQKPLPSPNQRATFSSNLVDQELQLPNEILALTKHEGEPERDHDLGAELMKLLPPDPDGPGLELPIEPAHLQPAPPAPASAHSPVETQYAPTEPETAPVVMQQPAPPVPEAATETYPWTSAANARQWLNSVSDPQTTEGLAGFLRTHRGDLSLGAAIVALLIVLVWGMSNHKAAPVRPTAPPTSGTSAAPTTASSSPPPAASSGKSRRSASDAQPDLSLGERALVALGLAEPPEPSKTYAGNPDVKVWVDVRTALYYCPDAELYGRTPKGKYLTQREAQLDQFEAATRKVCE